MLHLFRRKRQKAPPPPGRNVAEDFLPIESAHSLLAAEHRPLPGPIHPTQFKSDPLVRRTSPALPASETDHHAYLGGMLNHGLELAACCLKLRQSYLLPTGQAAQTNA